MIDSHCHLDLPHFEQDVSALVENAKSKGVSRFLLPGLSLEKFPRLLELQKQFACFDIALGLHPYFLRQDNVTTPSALIEGLCSLGHVNQDKIVAIGEAGLDGSLDIDMAYQTEVLQGQIELANELKKPLILHHRKSHNELITLLKKNKFKFGGVIHAFSGSYETAKTYIDLGFYLGVGGTISYPRAQKTRATIKKIGLEYLLLETDSPDMPLNGFQGQRNSPDKLPLVAHHLAELKQIDLNEIINLSDKNYYKLFALSSKR